MQLCPAQRGLPPMLLDGAHNPHGMQALRAGLGACGLTPSAVIFSCLHDKDVEHILPQISTLAERCPVFTVTIVDNERAAQDTDLAARIGGQARPCGTLRHALALCAPYTAAPTSAPVLICGSLYLLGEFFAMYPTYLSPSSLEAPHA